VNALTIAGGVFHEHATWPAWDQLYGSAGRAAAALAGHVASVVLRTYARPDTAAVFQPYAEAYGFTLDPVAAEQTISFEYVHSLSTPVIFPATTHIRPNAPFSVKADAVLRFGMMEGSAVIEAERCVYDPQSPFNPELFGRNGSRAAHIAIVANRSEIVAMGGNDDPIAAARSLLSDGAEVVVVKCGAAGAAVVEASGVTTVPTYRTERVWTLGSGDVFAAVFAARWAVHGESASNAARLASRAVATYVESMSLPVPLVETLRGMDLVEARVNGGKVYLASPFFTLGQRWLVDESRRCLTELGLDVFSPVHDIGPGPAETVARADLAALDDCDVVFAVLDGLDSGTLFEVGYARAKSKPVFVLAQTVSEEDLKMVAGSDCFVFDDFVTALHHVAWRT
jgi:nucleoside 2-deoxyribosyltransferase